MPVYAGEAKLIQSESEEFLYCSICRHKYDFHRSLPKVLPCAHTFCLTCLQTLHKETKGTTLKCPICKCVTGQIENVLSLPNNKHVHHIAHLTEKLWNARIQPTNVEDVIDGVSETLTPTPSSYSSRMLRVIDWGSLGSFMQERIDTFVKVIRLQNPDVVFFYDIDRTTLGRLQKWFPRFKFISEKKMAPRQDDNYLGGSFFGSYSFLRVTMLNASVSYDSHEFSTVPVQPWESHSDVNLNILKVKAHFGDMELILLNTQLTVDGLSGKYRQSLLKAIFEEVRNADENVNVIMGVGGYLGDKEVMSVGGLPSRTVDMWEACGKPKTCKLKFILDDVNLTLGGLSQENFTANFTRLEYLSRTDRFFLCPASTGTIAVPNSFRVIGIMKVSGIEHSVMMVDVMTKDESHYKN